MKLIRVILGLCLVMPARHAWAGDSTSATLHCKITTGGLPGIGSQNHVYREF